MLGVVVGLARTLRGRGVACAWASEVRDGCSSVSLGSLSTLCKFGELLYRLCVNFGLFPLNTLCTRPNGRPLFIPVWRRRGRGQRPCRRTAGRQRMQLPLSALWQIGASASRAPERPLCRRPAAQREGRQNRVRAAASAATPKTFRWGSDLASAEESPTTALRQRDGHPYWREP
jgi:hypothetical protein